MLSRIKWESIDDFRPPKGSLKHIPKSEHAGLFRARAQKDNNALALLRWKGSRPVTKKRKAARSHSVLVRPPAMPSTMSSIPLLGSLLSLMQAQKPRPVHSRQPCGSFSSFEALPFELKTYVMDYITINDRICLALTSTLLMRNANGYATLEGSDNEDEYGEENEVYDVLEYGDLMCRLRDWMPSNLGYCYHCLTYIPWSSFGPKTGDLDYLACMNCRFHSSASKPPHCSRCGKVDSCDGCLSLDLAVDMFMDDHPDMAHDDVRVLLDGLDFEDLAPFFRDDED